MNTKEQEFIDAGDAFDIAVSESRLLHFNGGQAHIQMWENRNTVLSIDFTTPRPQITIWLSERYVQDNKHASANYKERYKNWSMKEHLFNHFQKFPIEEVA